MSPRESDVGDISWGPWGYESEDYREPSQRVFGSSVSLWQVVASPGRALSVPQFLPVHLCVAGSVMRDKGKER